MPDRNGFRLWLGLVAVVILAGVFVPYGVLAGRDGSLIIVGFWCLFGSTVIGLILWGVSGWKDGR